MADKRKHVCNFPQHIPQHGERWTCPECGNVMEYDAGEGWWERVEEAINGKVTA